MRYRIASLSLLAAVLTSCGGNNASLPASWSRVFDDPLLGGADDQEMRAVVSTGDGLVAVGVDRSGGDADAAVWTSPDGVVWARVLHDEVVFGGPDTEWMWDVTTGPDGVVAVGFGGPDEAQHAAVWTSPDGVSWERVTHDPAVFDAVDGAAMFGVAVGSEGYVAVGTVRHLDDSGTAAVWTSPDASTWTRVPGGDAVFGSGASQSMMAVTWTGDRFVAVGLADDSAAVWISTEGTAWERVADPTGVFSGIGSTNMTAVTIGGPGLIAVGNGWAIDRPAAAVWTSPDGLSWTRVDHDAAVFGGLGPPLLTGVASGPGGVIAVGFDGEPDGASDVAIWASPDGLRWTRVDNDTLAAPNYQYAYDLAFHDGKVIVVGTDATIVGVGIVDVNAAVWVGE